MDPIQIMDEAKDSISSITVSDFEILTGSVDGYIRRYDMRNGMLHADCIGRKYYMLGVMAEWLRALNSSSYVLEFNALSTSWFYRSVGSSPGRDIHYYYYYYYC